MRARVTQMVAAGAGVGVILSSVAYALVGEGDEGGSIRIIRTGGTAPSSTPIVTSSTTAPTTTSSTVPPETTTTTTAPESDAGLLALQQRLAELGYDVGSPDGKAGWRTYYAIAAFQRAEGLTRTGEDNDEVRAALATAKRPGPLVAGGAPNRVEVDLDRQLLLLWRGGGLARILPVSTGNGERYCVDGDCDVAVTPTGTFQIGRKFRGLEVSRLGELYDPMYFYGGIAIHGSPSIPPYPASHGCVRVPMYASTSLYEQVPAGTTVYVVGDGPAAAEIAPPPDEPERPPAPPVLPEPEPEPEPQPEPEPAPTTTTEPPEPAETTTSSSTTTTTEP